MRSGLGMMGSYHAAGGDQYPSAGSTPSALLHTDGLINRMATQHGKPNLWSWERVRADLIVFRMTRSF
jgi:hypothetical protein